ncbi:MAG TPA: PKD-like family lipoprotein [Parasegetibacter sp.]
MNKLIKYIMALTIVGTTLSCYKDRGNYDYKDREDISISGIEPSYTVIGYEEKLNIQPQVSSNYTGADFEYFWGVYDGSGTVNARRNYDTIARTKDLDYRVDLPAGEWVITFAAKNKITGVASIFRSNVSVVTRFTRGWYVIRDNGTNTDVDLFTTPTNLNPGVKYEGLFEMVNGRSLEGKSGSLAFFTTYRSDFTGSLQVGRTFMLWSERDMAAVDLNTFQLIRDFNTIFYETPATRKPMSINVGMNAIYMINDGQLHSIHNIASNKGYFAGAKIADDQNTPYYLSKYYLATLLHNTLFYDELNSTFYSATGNGSTLVKTTSAGASKMPNANINKTLRYLGHKSYSAAMVGWAFLQDKTDPNLRILAQISAPNSNALTITPDTLLSTSNLYHAEKMTLLNGDENLIYFSRGNQVWSRNLSNKNEVLQFTVPAGETISFIRHRKFTGSAAAETNYYHNAVVVGTQVGNMYRIRVFNKVSGNISGNPITILEGNGFATDVMYMSPAVVGSTYQPTY